MSFFKFNKEINTKDLKLSDYDQIWTKFCFLDETGNLNNPTDPFFTVGILKLSQPYYLLNKLQYERNKRNFYDEMKFNKLSKRNVDFAKFSVGALFDARSIYFYSYSLDKEGAYFKREFSGDPWQAYQKIAIRLLKDVALAPKEILILLADHVTVPKHIRFEVDVKKEVNSSLKRLALAGVCRLDSRSNDLLQLVDLMIGTISYDLKIETGAIKGNDEYKADLLQFLKQNLGADKFMPGFRNRNFNIFVDKDMRLRLPLKTNEKGPSS
ncbi:hypothetical protein A3I40_03775 [Candidatus Uhrbacteria bacterium RIFCSPLOWO2_02_FULL_48_12]|uniref:DUF3800 domain-containing protein n=1 Tax=Candidatus Uhrbacteria bacterium RIFCSPLOWO2_02_FULL_48_12 TaxID=1802407 RepID=A0A1F7VA40_9BACT|nr:MAG: hypothetical protein A3I40_03775 [Candidatus Uhrbacteria bacterium RIFCSPLOWO2_02_FULL_48_12]